MKKWFQRMIAWWVVLMGLAVPVVADDMTFGLKFHTVGGYSAFGHEFLAGELAEIASYKQCVAFEIGTFASQVLTYPSAGISVDVRKAVELLGGDYKWSAPFVEPKLGLAAIVNPNVLLYGYKDRLADLVLHCNVFTVKI